MNRPRVLFLCTGNSCRSQMAEGWARHFGVLEPSSAGLQLNPLNPHAVQVMAEAGVDISSHAPKLVNVAFYFQRRYFGPEVFNLGGSHAD